MNWYREAASKHVWLSGPLCRTREGFYYLDVPGTIAGAFQWLLPQEKLVHPKEHWDNFVGAHISVMWGSEIGDKEVKELGKEFDYQITGLKSVKPTGKDYTVFFVEVVSPDLVALRKSYGLGGKINGHEFHISVGVRK